LGSGIEYGIGFWRMAFLYLVSEVGGVLLAITFHPESYGVGASCAGYGLLGFLAAYLFTNWSYMTRIRPGQRFFLLFITTLWIFMNQGISLNWQSHNIGHQGGLITGFFIGLAITEQYD
jgi:membrane associated rhomboid family serine protease